MIGGVPDIDGEAWYAGVLKDDMVSRVLYEQVEGSIGTITGRYIGAR
jgi:hypothetical protein